MDNLKAEAHYQIIPKYCPTMKQLDECVGRVEVFAYIEVTGQYTAQDTFNPKTGTYNYKLVTVDDKILPFKATFKFKLHDDGCLSTDIIVKCCDPVSPVEIKGASEQTYSDAGATGVPLAKHFVRESGVLTKGSDGKRCCESSTAAFQWAYGDLVISVGGSASGSAGGSAGVTVGGVTVVGGSAAGSAGGSGAAGVALNGGVIQLGVNFTVCWDTNCYVNKKGDVTDGEQVFDAGGIWSPR